MFSLNIAFIFQVLLIIALFGIAHCGRLDNKYLPPNQQASSGNQQGYTDNQQGYSGNQQGFSGSQQGYSGSQQSYSGNQQTYSGSQQAYSGNQPAVSSNQYNGPIDKAANDVPILRLENNNDGETYKYAYETGNGISAQEEGDARGDGTKALGGFSYTAPDGQQITIQYTADENGFLPQGSHLPVAPPVPEEILKAVEQNLADEARGIFDDGQYRADGAGQYRHDGAGQYNHGENGDNKYNAGPSTQYNAGVSGQYNGGSALGHNTGSTQQYNSGSTQQHQYNTGANQQSSDDGYRY